MSYLAGHSIRQIDVFPTLAFDLGTYSMTTVLQPIMPVVDPIAAAAWYGCGGAAIGFALSRLDDASNEG